MGNFYTNITLRGPNQDQIVAYLRAEGRTTYVTPTVRGCTVVFDSEEEMSLESLAATLSRHFNCVPLAIMNHDDDVLWHQLYQAGKLIDEYQVEAILRKSSWGDDGYTFAFERHRDLFQALGIPSFSVAAGYRYLEAGEFPHGLEAPSLARTS